MAMRKISVHKGLFCGLLVLGLAACGGAATEPETAKSKAETGADAEADAKPGDEAKPKAGEKTTQEVPDKTPEDFITEPETFFALSFKESDFGNKKIEACEKQAKGDPEKRSKCVVKAGTPYEGEGVRFIQDDDGTWWWITMGLRGGKVYIKHRIEFEVAGHTDKTVTLKLKGRDRGPKPMAWMPSELVIEVPNDYEIYIDEKARGKLIYKARVATGDEDDK
jgi:hypothetical protein